MGPFERKAMAEEIRIVRRNFASHAICRDCMRLVGDHCRKHFVAEDARIRNQLRALCHSAIENHCTMLEAGNGCEDYGRDVAEWCGVCLLVHDVRAALDAQSAGEKEE